MLGSTGSHTTNRSRSHGSALLALDFLGKLVQERKKISFFVFRVAEILFSERKPCSFS